MLIEVASAVLPMAVGPTPPMGNPFSHRFRAFLPFNRNVVCKRWTGAKKAAKLAAQDERDDEITDWLPRFQTT